MPRRKYDLGRDGLWRLVLSLAVPTALAQAVNVLYAIVDRMFIGHIAGYGDIALAGVGVAAPIATFISSFATLIGMGGAPIMAMCEGHGDHETAERTVTTGFYLLLISSAILTPVFLIFRDPILMAFGASAATLPHASEYLGWYLLGTPFALLSGGLNSFVINQGMSKKGMVSVLTGAVMNIILDPVFIFTLSMGVKGAAIATVISQMASMAVSIAALRQQDTAIRLRFRGFLPRQVSKIIKFGLSSFIIISTDSVLLIVLNAMLQRYGGPDMGDILITCSTIVQSYHILVTYPMGGMTAGCQGLISYNYGAGLTDRMRQCLYTGIGMALLFGVSVCAYSQFWPETLTGIFTHDAAVITIGAEYLHGYSIDCIIVSFVFCFNAYFSGQGNSWFPMIHSLIATFLFRIPLSWAFSHIDPTSLLWMGFAPPLATTISLLICFWYLRRQTKNISFHKK